MPIGLTINDQFATDAHETDKQPVTASPLL
jgi:hypothetical protein